MKVWKKTGLYKSTDEFRVDGIVYEMKYFRDYTWKAWSTTNKNKHKVTKLIKSIDGISPLVKESIQLWIDKCKNDLDADKEMFDWINSKSS